jgi:plasmid stabilization system protein ParE
LCDINAHVAYLDQCNPRAAGVLAQALLAAGDSLVALPLRGRRGRIGGTCELAAVHPYVIVYEVSRDAVSILRVWHGAQLA